MVVKYRKRRRLSLRRKKKMRTTFAPVVPWVCDTCWEFNSSSKTTCLCGEPRHRAHNGEFVSITG